MGNQAAESILHGIVAAIVVMVLMRAQRIRVPDTRLRFWLLATGLPLSATPLYWWLAPWRHSERFRDDWSLFSASHLAPYTFHGVALSSTVALLLALAGTLLYLRDLVPFALDFLRGRATRRAVIEPPTILVSATSRAAAALGIAVPRLTVLPSKHPILICRGLRRPNIVVSSGLCQMLAPDELQASIAHEMAHAKHRDPVLGWGLMVMRGLAFFNPAVQLAARAAALEVERRADQAAARIVGSADAVVQSLRKLSGSDGARLFPSEARTWHGFRLAAIEVRCQALLHEQGTAGEVQPAWILPATAIGLGVILFMTVA
jgi:Zn-dependent protease with chaperone function